MGKINYQSLKKKIELKIPAGVDNGSKMRLSHEGDAGKNGGVSGDLYIVIHVKPSNYYQREGVNVFTKLELIFFSITSSFLYPLNEVLNFSI